MIERLSNAMGAALVGNNFSPIPWKFHLSEQRLVLGFGLVQLAQMSLVVREHWQVLLAKFDTSQLQIISFRGEEKLEVWVEHHSLSANEQICP